MSQEVTHVVSGLQVTEFPHLMASLWLTTNSGYTEISNAFSC